MASVLRNRQTNGLHGHAASPDSPMGGPEVRLGFGDHMSWSLFRDDDAALVLQYERVAQAGILFEYVPDHLVRGELRPPLDLFDPAVSNPLEVERGGDRITPLGRREQEVVLTKR